MLHERESVNHPLMPKALVAKQWLLIQFVIFHNKLTTLEEERRDDSPSDYTECNSVSEESEEQDNTAALLLAEKYIRARWEYSLQVMNLGCIGGGMSGALLDARDEINDMLRPSNTIPDDSSVEVEGEI